MKIDFDGLPQPEPSSMVGFSQNRLIRDSEYRDETSLPAALENPATRFFMFAGSSVIISKGEISTAAFGRSEIESLDTKLERAILLGEAEDGPRIAVPVDVDVETLGEPWAAYDLRALLYSTSVKEEDAGAIAQAGSMLHWHRMNRFCGKCGHASAMKIGGYRRDCPSCENQIFPRTDPVVIMLAVKEDKCLLGRSPNFPEGWYSTLAGFIEPGETMEDAVRRETLEESGIQIGRVKYHSSQPWPFPHSLMIGVHCEAISEDITVNESELEDCRWFTRGEVQLMIEEKHPEGFICPPNKAISSALVGAWAEG